MATSIIQLLNRLAQAAPEACSYDPIYYRYFIGDYGFRISDDELKAWIALDLKQSATGRPALAWLRDAVEQAIEARGWRWQVKCWNLKQYIAEIEYYEALWGDTPAEALLAAFVAALEGEKEG